MGFISRLLGVEKTEEVQVTATLMSFKRLKVVGESHYQPALLAACGAEPGAEVRYECFAELVPEPENPHDRNAVMVMLDGRQVGYLTKPDAAEWQGQLIELRDAGQATICHAFIGCIGAERGNPNLGVSLKIPVSPG